MATNPLAAMVAGRYTSLRESYLEKQRNHRKAFEDLVKKSYPGAGFELMEGLTQSNGLQAVTTFLVGEDLREVIVKIETTGNSGWLITLFVENDTKTHRNTACYEARPDHRNTPLFLADQIASLMLLSDRENKEI
jgi:hypothetical protein